MNTSELKAKAEALLTLHDRRAVLVLPNAWDAASAKVFAESGFAAIATTSGGICRILGLPDSEIIGRDQMLSMVRTIVRAVEAPVTADLLAGFGATPAEVGDTARAALEAGVVGMNIEDSPGRDAPLREVEQQCERIAAAREAAERAGVPMVINARVDAWVRQVASGQERVELAIARGRAYLTAGASCIYPILASDSAEIAALTRAIDGPLNVMMRPGVPAIAELEKIGVARVSFGSGMMTAALAFTKRMAQQIRTSGSCDLLNAK